MLLLFPNNNNSSKQHFMLDTQTSPEWVDKYSLFKFPQNMCVTIAKTRVLLSCQCGWTTNGFRDRTDKLRNIIFQDTCHQRGRVSCFLLSIQPGAMRTFILLKIIRFLRGVKSPPTLTMIKVRRQTLHGTTHNRREQDRTHSNARSDVDMSMAFAHPLFEVLLYAK